PAPAESDCAGNQDALHGTGHIGIIAVACSPPSAPSRPRKPHQQPCLLPDARLADIPVTDKEIALVLAVLGDKIAAILAGKPPTLAS
ncbi:MAG: hypothetical protein KGQ40_15030, partial [Rhodospirillales bacterium]|nr:hypothetical protein [Rhodospirillales bacterium]